ncbi:hypothetical protein TURU_119048 [Turdus rufiventris]|nr:hypothetical protein TURU_119048 [Turdus rufiventris]
MSLFSTTRGIPENPTGQSIVERTHQTLKRVLNQQHRDTEILSPVERLCKALYVINFLNCTVSQPDPPILQHFANSTQAKITEKPSVLVAAEKALGEIDNSGCWLSKQENVTSAALSDLLKDEETTRHASLQNCAAIDFLLLAHGHGCQDLEGMCCFNLSSCSTSIHANIQKLQVDLVVIWGVFGMK